MKNNVEKIVKQPSYWIEGINGVLYDAIVTYMEKNKLNRKQLAEVLGVSKGRISQILNEGDINFSIEKIVDIAFKVGKIPIFELQDLDIYLEKLDKSKNTMRFFHLNPFEFSKESFLVEPQEDKGFSTYQNLKIVL